MDAMMHCRDCGTALKLPKTAAGHRARCRKCGRMFTVPPADQLIEETVSTWIEQDVDELFDHRHRRIEQQLAPVHEHQRHTPSAAASHGTPPPELKSRQGTEADGDGEGQPEAESAQLDQDQKEKAAQEPAVAEHPAARAESHAEAASAAADGNAPEAAPDAADSAEPAPEPAGVVDGVAGEGETSSRYPTALNPTEPRPHLVVRGVSPAGVRFAFDSHWLEHEGFRASLPVRCAFSGNSERQQLIARPMLFTDQAHGESAQRLFDQLIANHENRLIGEHTPRQIMQRMGNLEKLPHPFHLPMPYYVSTHYATLSLHCETHPRADGITCELIIPDPHTALAWLERVNGACGEEYALLEEDIALMHGHAWRELSETTRQRISEWCKLRPREEVGLFLGDADLGKRDEGFAGLLVTDQRLVFRKHHHRGQVDRQQEGRLRCLCEGNFVTLKLQLGGNRQRMIKIRRRQLQSLLEELNREGHITPRVEETQPNTS